MGYGTWGVDEDPSALKSLKSSCQSRLGKAKTRYFYSGHLEQLGNLGHAGHMGHWGSFGSFRSFRSSCQHFQHCHGRTDKLTNIILTDRSVLQTNKLEHLRVWLEF